VGIELQSSSHIFEKGKPCIYHTWNISRKRETPVLRDVGDFTLGEEENLPHKGRNPERKKVPKEVVGDQDKKGKKRRKEFGRLPKKPKKSSLETDPVVMNGPGKKGRILWDCKTNMRKGMRR